MFTYCSTIHDSEDLEPTQMPINDRLGTVCTMDYYAAIKKNEFVSFGGTWMKPEAIILGKLTWEEKTKHCIFSLISES